MSKPDQKKARRLAPFKGCVEGRGIPYTTARDYALRGEIPYFKFGRAWYVDEAEIDKFIERAKAAPDS